MSESTTAVTDLDVAEAAVQFDINDFVANMSKAQLQQAFHLFVVQVMLDQGYDPAFIGLEHLCDAWIAGVKCLSSELTSDQFQYGVDAISMSLGRRWYSEPIRDEAAAERVRWFACEAAKHFSSIIKKYTDLLPPAPISNGIFGLGASGAPVAELMKVRAVLEKSNAELASQLGAIRKLLEGENKPLLVEIAS